MTQQNGNRTSWASVGALFTIIAIMFAGTWAVFQAQFAALEKRLDAASRRSDSFVSQSGFAQYEKRIDGRLKSTADRLLLIEQTRPTAGELKGVADSTRADISRILDRLDKMNVSR